MSQPEKPKPDAGVPPADWLAAQAKFQQAGRPKPRPKSSYITHHRQKVTERTRP